MTPMSGAPPPHLQKAWAWCRANKEFVAVMLLAAAVLFVGFQLSEIADRLGSIDTELSDIDLSISSIANRL